MNDISICLSYSVFYKDPVSKAFRFSLLRIKKCIKNNRFCDVNFVFLAMVAEEDKYLVEVEDFDGY